MTTLQLIALAGWLIVMGGVLRRLNIASLWQDKKVQHLVFGSAACLFGLWWFRAGIFDGLNVHFMWLSALCLTLGWRFAMLSATIALIGVTLIGKESWAMLGVNGLLGVAAPISLTYLLYSLSFHKLPRHLFVYIFVCAFFPGALAIATKMGLLAGYYFLDGTYNWTTLTDNYLVLITLMLFPEAMLNGMTMTLLIIYKPQWVYTFYDKFYLQDKD